MTILDRYDRSAHPVSGTNVKFSCSCFNSFFYLVIEKTKFRSHSFLQRYFTPEHVLNCYLNYFRDPGVLEIS